MLLPALCSARSFVSAVPKRRNRNALPVARSSSESQNLLWGSPRGHLIKGIPFPHGAREELSGAEHAQSVPPTSLSNAVSQAPARST